MNINIELITKLILIILVFIILIVYKKPLSSLLTKGSIKYKRNGTEIEVISKKIKQESQTTNEEQVALTIEKNVNESIPKTEKVENDYLKQLFDAYIKRDKELLVQAFESIENSSLDGNEKTKYKAYYYMMKYKLGDTEALSKLEELSEKNKSIPEIYPIILNQLALCYQEANQYEKAIKIYGIAQENSNDVSAKAQYTSSIASCLLELQQNDDALDIIIKAINNETNKEALYIYYKQLADVYDKLKEEELKIFALEKALEFSSNNENLTFHIAYNYGDESNFKDLKLLHYKNLLKINPKNPGGLNNIGITYSELGLNGLKINSYKKAIDEGNTLACANISYEYMSKGFYEEANKILKEASLKEDVHENVIASTAKLNENIKFEEENEKLFLDNAIIKQRFIRKFAEAYFTTIEILDMSSISLKYNESILKIEQNENLIKGMWNENSTEFMFEGKINNKAIKAKVSKMQRNPYTQTENYVKYADAYIFITKDNDTLSMLIIEDNKLFNIKDFKKLAQTETV